MNLQITDVPLPVRMTFDKPLTDDKRVTIYWAGGEAEVLNGPEIVRRDGVTKGFELDMKRNLGLRLRQSEQE
jgi:hypothetical protein